MKSLNSFINFRSSRPNLQSSNISPDRWLTVGSLSGLNAKWMLKLVAVLAILLAVGVGNAWGETYVMYPNNGSTFNSSWSKTSRTARGCYSNITTNGLQLMGENGGTYGEVSSNSTFTGISAISVSATATGSRNLELYYSANGSSWTKLTQVSVSKDQNKYNTYNYTLTGLPSTAIYIKFRAASSSIYIYSITVTTGSTKTLDFSEPNEAVQNRLSFSYYISISKIILQNVSA